jgi:RNA polymerase sigma factor FliA
MATSANVLIRSNAAATGALSYDCRNVSPSDNVNRSTKAISKTSGTSADLTSRDAVILEHLPLVKAVAKRVHSTLPAHVHLDDLISAGIVGLLDAASKYNVDRKVAFSAYAKHRIRGAILDSLRQLDSASRHLRRRHKQIEEIRQTLTLEFRRTPTEAEIAERLGCDIESLRQTLLELHNAGVVSADTRADEYEHLPAPEHASEPEAQPDHMFAQKQRQYILDAAMATLPERYRQVVAFYYANDMTLKEIGQILGVNESRVSQIHRAALEKMNTALRMAGVCSVDVI